GLLLVLFLARHFARSQTARSWRLLIVRGGVLAVLLALLLNPVRVSETQLPPRVPELVYLVDCSRSMALDQPESRLDQVKRVLEKSKRLAAKAPAPRVGLYRFGTDLLAASEIRELRADDDATRLVDALERLPSRFSEAPPGGLVVFSDGRTTENAGLEEIVAAYRRLKIP